MLKALIKKQMLEINSFMFLDRKKGKRKSKMGILFSGFLYVFIFGYMVFLFDLLFDAMAKPFVSLNLEWFYFLMVALLGIVIGIFGSVFNTYSSLYLAKDNELILSMPIKDRDIIISRLFGVYFMGVYYSSMAYVGAVIPLITLKLLNIKMIIGLLISFLVVSIIVLILSALLGWGVAILSVKFNKKSYMTVIGSLIFIGLYYFVYFKALNMFSDFVKNAALIASKLDGSFNPIYHLGNMATGDLKSIILSLFLAVVLLMCTFKLLLNNLSYILTFNKGEKKKVYVEKRLQTSSQFKAMFIKELKRFTSSANYMLNSGLGILMMPIAAVYLIIKNKMVLEIMQEFGFSNDMYVLVGIGMVVLMVSMCNMTSSSVSLEGKSIWIYQTLPIKPIDILKAKIALQYVLTQIPALIVTVACAYVFKFNMVHLILVLTIIALYIFMISEFGLVLNLLWPNLTWTYEVVVIKQSLPSFVSIFGVLGIVIVLGFTTMKLLEITSLLVVMIIMIVILLVMVGGMYVWLDKVGTKKFNRL